MSQTHFDALSDVVAETVARLLQEQLAPILSTLREHARLLDCHTALLNHSTVMNRYNVGKLDDLRELQNHVNFMLQFSVQPERRCRPTYHNPPPAPRLRRTTTVVDVASSLLGPCPNRASGPLNEPSSSDSEESTDTSATNAPDARVRSPSPTPTEPASLPPTSPRAPAGHRRLRRERAFGDVSDPMWTTSRELDLDIVLPPPPPPPPYVMPPAYTEENPAAQDTATTTDRSSRAVRSAPADTPQVATPPPSQPHVEAPGPSRSIPSAPAVATAVTAPRTSDPEPVSEAGPSRLSERAAGKKRRRDDDDEGDNAETSAGSSGSGSDSRNDERERERKRLRADTTISLERLPLSEELLERARSCSYPELTPNERQYQYEKLRAMKKLFRPGSTGK